MPNAEKISMMLMHSATLADSEKPMVSPMRETVALER